MRECKISRHKMLYPRHVIQQRWCWWCPEGMSWWESQIVTCYIIEFEMICTVDPSALPRVAHVFRGDHD